MCVDQTLLSSLSACGHILMYGVCWVIVIHALLHWTWKTRQWFHDENWLSINAFWVMLHLYVLLSLLSVCVLQGSQSKALLYFYLKASSVMPFLVLPKYVCHWLQQACRTLPSCEALRCEQYDDLQKRSVEAWLLVPQLQMSKTVNIREARCLM